MECAIGSLATGATVTGSVTVTFTSATGGSGTTLFGVDADERDANAVNDAVSVPLTFSAVTPPPPTPNAGSNGGGGGCSYRPGSPFDPTLPAILVSGLLGLLVRRAWRRKQANA